MDTDPRDDKELAATGKMSFLDHLDELRRRIIVAVAAVGISFVVCWIFHERIFEFLSVPITQHLGDRKLTYLSPTEPFMIYMKASFYAGIFLVSPVVLWQVWLFIAPGLYSREKRYAIPFLLSSSTLFVLGGVFAYQVGLPMTLNFLTNFGHAFQEIVTATFYFDFALVVILGCAIIFEIPIVIFFSLRHGHHQCPLPVEESPLRGSDYFHCGCHHHANAGHPDPDGLRHAHALAVPGGHPGSLDLWQEAPEGRGIQLTFSGPRSRSRG